MNQQIEKNIKAHNAIAKRYEKEHIEIYNVIEQERLEEALKGAFEKIETNSYEKSVLDFGCGAGNLTQYLLKMGMRVISADISKNFLELVKYKYSRDHREKLSFLELNGSDLSNVEDESFDLIATYSVLHHIPNYLLVIKEFIRVLKPGGVLYIDHEASPDVWEKKIDYIEYKKILDSEIFKKTKFERMKHLFMFSYWKNAIEELRNPRYRAEGDIHVFLDDHIEWDSIRELLSQNKMEIISEKDFLLYTKYCPKDLYDKYKDKCNDIRFLIARKIK